MTKLSLLQYSLLAWPLAFVGMPLYIHAPDMYATQAGLSLATVGLIIHAVRVFDAIQDPLIGYLSYKFSRYRFHTLAIFMVLLAAGFVMLFNPPETGVVLWFAISLILATSAFSVISINFNSLGSLWCADTHDKMRVSSWREFFGLIGLLCAAALPAIITLNQYSIVMVGLLLFTALLFFYWLRANHETIVRREQSAPGIDWRVLLRHQNRRFFAAYFFSMLASSIPAVLVIFFIRDRLDAEALTGMFLLLYFLSGALSMPLWLSLSKRVDKYRAWLISMVMAIATFIWAYFLGAGDIYYYAAICLLSGAALGAELALPPAILSDMVDQQKQQRQTPFYFAALAFLLKTTFALGSGLAFLLLGVSSFVPAAENSEAALHVLGLTYAVLPCAIKIGAAVILTFELKRQFKGDQHAFSFHHIFIGGHNGS